MEKMTDPELRRAVLAEAEEADRRLQAIQAGVGGKPERLIVQGVNRQADLQQYVGRSLGEIAETEGKHPIEVMLDLSLQGDLNVEFLGPDRGMNADFMAEMTHDTPYPVPGVSDGGAHTKFFNGGSWSTDYLRWLVRDEAKVTLEEAHYRMSSLAAHAAGFKDRGTIREGSAADIVVYKMEELDIEPNWIGDVVHDLPGGEWRRVQRAKGYHHILINGVETFRDGECTGETPGKLLRHGHA
jgi:N-acyl-D-aspartate/D-glutamate deacylase